MYVAVVANDLEWACNPVCLQKGAANKDMWKKESKTVHLSLHVISNT